MSKKLVTFVSEKFAEYLILGMPEYSEDTDSLEQFKEHFEFVGDKLADEVFYQGLNKMTVIRRKLDGTLFGFRWFDDVSKYGESFIEPNGGEYNDYPGQPDGSYVFAEVEPFQITGYRFVDD